MGLSRSHQPWHDQCEPQQNRGFTCLLSLYKYVPCSALKLQCNGRMQGVGFYWKTKENVLAVVALGVKMRQRRNRRREAFERNLLSSCSYKSPEIPTQTYMDNSEGFYFWLSWTPHIDTHRLAHINTLISHPLPLPLSLTHINTCIQRTDTHTPNQWSSLGTARASEMRQRRRGGGGGE